MKALPVFSLRRQSSFCGLINSVEAMRRWASTSASSRQSNLIARRCTHIPGKAFVSGRSRTPSEKKKESDCVLSLFTPKAIRSKHSSHRYLKTITSSHGKYFRRYMCLGELKCHRDDRCDEHDRWLITTQVHWWDAWESHENGCGGGDIEDSYSH